MAEADKTRNVPMSALRFGGIEVEFGDNGEGARSAPIRMVARSPQPIEHWYWGRVVHDLAGMTLHKDRLPVDYCHDYDQVIGYLNKFDPSGEKGLVVSGALTPFKDSDRATEIIHKSKAGVPWEASINFGGDGIRVEEVPENAVAKVNGYELQGPATIIRQWPLRGVAVCPYGADMNTSSEMGQDQDKTVAVTVLPARESRTMADKDTVEVAPATVETELEDQPAEAPDTGAVDAEGQPAADPPADEPAQDDPAEAPVEPEAVDGEDQPAGDAPAEPAEGVDAEDATGEALPTEHASEGQRFLDAFGEKGGVWFAQGKTFAEAQQLHVADLEARAKALADENGRLKKSLAAARGEAEPVEFVADGEKPTADSEQDKQLDQNLGPNLSRVAKGFKKAPS